jgi:hypothetical protein
MSDFSTALVQDERLDLTSSVEFAVYKGAATIAPTTYPATGTPTNTAHQYQITVPSLEVVLDRAIIWESQFTLNFSSGGVNLPIGEYLLDLNGLDALQAFPLQHLITQMNVQINSTQVNINMQDMLPQLLTMVSREELLKWNNMTPTYIDNYAKYEDAVKTGNVNNPIGNYGAGVHPEYVPRGYYVYDNIINPVGTGAPSNASITVTCREPLICSPLLFSSTDEPGLQGVNQLNFQINIDSTGKRVFSSSTTDANGVARVVPKLESLSFTPGASVMYVNFLTPSPFQLAKFSPRNVVGYYQLDRYITPFKTNLLAGATDSGFTQSIQLPCIPDSMILCVKESQADLSTTIPDRFATITKVSISFNAKQNILAQASQQLLYRYAKEAGSQSTWAEFSGQACVGTSIVSKPAIAGGPNVNQSVQEVVGTSGTVLPLLFGKHIDIPELYLAPSSSGQFNLQVEITYKNNTGSTFLNPNAVMIIFMSGLFSTEKSVSQTFSNLLSKDAVMQVLDDKPVSGAHLDRLVGGSWLKSLLRVGKVLAPALAPLAKEQLGKMGSMGKVGADVIGALGYGRSGGMSHVGMGRSAGALKKHLM